LGRISKKRSFHYQSALCPLGMHVILLSARLLSVQNLFCFQPACRAKFILLSARLPCKIYFAFGEDNDLFLGMRPYFGRARSKFQSTILINHSATPMHTTKTGN